MPVGARAAGVAEAFTMAADDTLSLYYNPAGIMHIRRPELGTSYSRLFMGMKDKSELSRSFIGYAQRLPKNRGAFGVSYIQYGLTGLYTENTVALSYAREAGEKWNVGGSVKMLRKSFGSDEYTENAINPITGQALGARDPFFNAGTSKSALALDLGSQFRLTNNYAFGLAIRNVNQPQMGIGSGDDKAPAVFSAAFGRWTRGTSLSIEGASWKFGNAQDMRLSLGAERWFKGGFGMRAGLAAGSRQYRNLALGFSYRMDGFQIDYAFNFPLAGLDTLGTHLVSLSYRFGKPAPDAVEMELDAERKARLKAEAEMVRLRAQLMELTSEKGASAVTREAPAVDLAAQDAYQQAQQEIERLKSQPKLPATPAEAPARPAAQTAAVPRTAAAAPAKPSVSPEVLSQYSDALRLYSRQTKSGADLSERKNTLKQILDKFGNSGLNLTAVQTELTKLEGQNSRVTQDYQMSVSYYRRIVQQGSNNEERVILLERIIKKFKPLGADTHELERELDSLRK